MPNLFLPVLSLLAAPLAYLAAVAFYNLYLHPLRNIPGPKYLACSHFGYCYHLAKGNLNATVHRAHEKYGEVIRVAPNELSFTSGETAWQDIYGVRNGKDGKQHYMKDQNWYLRAPNDTFSIVSAPTVAYHTRHRRLLGHAFSDKALREQEPILQHYVDLMVKRLGEQSEGGLKNVDMIRWWNFLTFDVIGDLTYGENFDTLNKGDYTFLATTLFLAAKAIGVGIILRLNKWAQPLLYPFIGAALEKRLQIWQFSCSLVDKRRTIDTNRPDFMYFAQKHADDEKGIPLNEMYASLFVITAAGSETTATILSGTTYYLSANPDKLRKLQDEIRSRFKRLEDISVGEVNHLPYLIACLSEGFRLYPPVPTGFPRKVPAGGDTISGHFIPGDASVYVSQYAAGRSSRNFKDPESYIPERWLEGNEEFASDKRSVVQPFSYGPRNCIGKNLAYSEMRLALAKVVWAFDMELQPESRNWLDQKVYVLWDKPSLMVRLKSVQRTPNET